MQRSWEDELGRSWSVEVDVPDPSVPEESGDTVLVFGREGELERRIDVLGPLEEVFEDLDDDALQHALDASATSAGLILVDMEGTLWWVRGPGPEDTDASWVVKFSDGTRELTHEGPIFGDAESLTEDELLELLDEGRGRVMDPMDVTGG